MTPDQITPNHGIPAGYFAHRWCTFGNKKKRTKQKGLPFEIFLTLENHYLTPGKCQMNQVVPAVLALPRAAGSITTLLGFCL